MIKLNDLEDMAEPPLDGVPEASSLVMRQNEAMDSNAKVGRRAGANNIAQFSPENETFGPM